MINFISDLIENAWGLKLEVDYRNGIARVCDPQEAWFVREEKFDETARWLLSVDEPNDPMSGKTGHDVYNTFCDQFDADESLRRVYEMDPQDRILEWVNGDWDTEDETPDGYATEYFNSPAEIDDSGDIWVDRGVGVWASNEDLERFCAWLVGLGLMEADFDHLLKDGE